MADQARVVATSSSKKSDGTDDSNTSSSKESVMSSDTGESSSSPPSNAEIVLKPSTSLWKREDLLALKICVSSLCDMKITPLDIVNMIDLHHIGLTSFFVEESKFHDLITKLERRVKFIANEIRNTTAHQVMTKSIDDMDDNDVLFQLHNVWTMRPPHLFENEEDFLKSSFQVYGRAFSRYLRDCIYLRDKQGKDLSEYAYQHLFVNFMQVFGVKCQYCKVASKMLTDEMKVSQVNGWMNVVVPSAPLIPTNHMRILGQKVSGVPDIIGKFNIYDDGEFKQKSLFVCKVKKHYEREDEPAPKKMRLSPSSKFGLAMPDALLGQHGGDLLLYYPSSTAKNASVGLIIEKTHVTFTVLLVTEEDFSKLKDGSLRLKKTVGPKLIFTRPYNFMLKEDRDNLIEPLLKLGFIQDIGYNC